MDYKSVIEDLLEQADWAKQYSLEQAQILEKAVQLAESHQDFELTARSKSEYIGCLTFLGFQEKAFGHFAWLLAHLEHPNMPIDESTILWKYKWMVGCMTDYLNLSSTQIIATLEDMEKRFLANNSDNQRVVLDYKRRIYHAMGYLEQAETYYQLFEKQEARTNNLSIYFTNELDDCRACTLNNLLSYWLLNSDFEKVLEEAVPILEGKMACGSVPKTTYPKICMAYTALDRLEDAEKNYKKGAKALQKVPDEQHLQHQGQLMTYLIRTGKHTPALKIFEKQFHFLQQTMRYAEIYHFLLVSRHLFEALLLKKKTISWTLPENDWLYQADGQYNVQTVLDTIVEKIDDLATQFDARNGNDYFSKQLPAFYRNVLGLT